MLLCKHVKKVRNCRSSKTISRVPQRRGYEHVTGSTSATGTVRVALLQVVPVRTPMLILPFGTREREHSVQMVWPRAHSTYQLTQLLTETMCSTNYATCRADSVLGESWMSCTMSCKYIHVWTKRRSLPPKPRPILGGPSAHLVNEKKVCLHTDADLVEA